MRIVFTGGHHNSSLALALILRDEYAHEIRWLGHFNATSKDKKPSAEYIEVTKAGIEFKTLHAGKVYKTIDLKQLLRVPLGFIESLLYLLTWRPALIVSFGGYLAVPAVIIGFFLGIPSVTHEQTVVSGLANKVIARFARKIFVTWESSMKYFPENKSMLVGLPLRKEIFVDSESFHFPANNKTTIYITAGKQGSHVINMAVLEVLPELLRHFNVIHQCGSTTEYNDLDTLEKARASLPEDAQERYIITEYIVREAVGSAFARADFVIARSGAHTIYELAALKKPAILIPIPWVSHNEQLLNAKELEKTGSARILEQKDLTGKTLLENALVMSDSITDYKKHAEANSLPIRLNSVDLMAQQIQNLLQ